MAEMQCSSELLKIKEEIRQKINQLNYVLHKDVIIKRSTEYNKTHQKLINARKAVKYHSDPEYRKKEIQRVIESIARNRILKGLCHKCFASNIDIDIIKGVNLCKGCAIESDVL